jgi:hypothetical protein
MQFFHELWIGILRADALTLVGIISTFASLIGVSLVSLFSWAHRPVGKAASKYKQKLDPPGEKSGSETINTSLVDNNSDEISITLLGSQGQLPEKTYDTLIGREHYSNALLQHLHNTSIHLIVLSGMGGIGKTALAREVVGRCLDDRSFLRIIWVSAVTQYFVGEKIQQLHSSRITFEDILTKIAHDCRRYDIVCLPFHKKRAAVSCLLEVYNLLLVIDNLETVEDSDRVVDDLSSIIGRSKLLMTTRHAPSNEIARRIHLPGLEGEGVRRFLLTEAERRDLSLSSAIADPAILDRIGHVTGGAPLAMKLVIGQLKELPLDVVLQMLSRASSREDDYELYRFLFIQSWELLSSDEREVLVNMSVFPPNIGDTADAISEISTVSKTSLWRAMRKLVQLSLVEKTGVGREVYFLHPLTSYFVQSDITKELLSSDPEE